MTENPAGPDPDGAGPGAGAAEQPVVAAGAPDPPPVSGPVVAAGAPDPPPVSGPVVAAGAPDPAPVSGRAGTTAHADPLVRAAGGAVWRQSGNGDLEVILVHRPRYDDWSLPKGKVDPGETDEQAALREVREEASIDARLGPELPTTTYRDRSGKQKRVRYWAMTPAGGEAAGDHEVDEAGWVPLDEARARLTYPRDVAVLDALVQATGGSDRR